MIKMPKNLRECLQCRINENEDNYYYVTLWDEEVKCACADITETIRFIKNNCTDEELWWFGEVVEDVVKESQSRELVEALRERSFRVTDSLKKEEIQKDIESASMSLEKL